MLAWLFARAAGSEFLLRFEDLDTASVQAESYDTQRRDLEAIGIDWDSEMRQSDHLDRYHDALRTLTNQGLTYPCFCSRREIREAAAAPQARRDGQAEGAYTGTCRELTGIEAQARADAGRPPAIRLRSPDQLRTFTDDVLGERSVRLDDQVLARGNGTPAYNLVVVIDDAYQDIEQVVRADDLADSTPRQIEVARLLDIDPPRYAHVPLVLGPDGKRLAKRDGSVTLADRQALGETPAQVRSWLARSLGLAAPDEQPDPHELIDRFDPTALPREPWQLSGLDVGQDLVEAPREPPVR